MHDDATLGVLERDETSLVTERTGDDLGMPLALDQPVLVIDFPTGDIALNRVEELHSESRLLGLAHRVVDGIEQVVVHLRGHRLS